MTAKVTWTTEEGLGFIGAAKSGFEVKLDAAKEVGGRESGFRPMELMALGLAGCTAMDVLSILRKKRQDVTDFIVQVDTEASPEHPKVWTSVHVEYLVTGNDIDPKAVERAIELSSTKYCPAQNMIKLSAEIRTSYQVIAAQPA